MVHQWKLARVGQTHALMKLARIGQTHANQMQAGKTCILAIRGQMERRGNSVPTTAMATEVTRMVAFALAMAKTPGAETARLIHGVKAMTLRGIEIPSNGGTLSHGIETRSSGGPVRLGACMIIMIRTTVMCLVGMVCFLQCTRIFGK